MDKRRRILVRDFIIVNAAGVIGALVLLCSIMLIESGIVPKYKCAFLRLTHMYCPGCGGTRAFFALLKGNIPASLCYNPAVVLGAGVIMYYEITVLMSIFSKKGKIYYSRKPWILYLYIAIVLVYCIVRNILLAGFGIDLMSVWKVR